MKKNIKKVNFFIRVGMIYILLCVFIFQLFWVFKNYETKFQKPIGFIQNNYSADFITQYRFKFEEIKKDYCGVTKFSYLSEEQENFSIGWTHYFLTQYYMAPNLTAHTKMPNDTLLYNLYNTKHLEPTRNYYLNNGWHIVKDYNNGLIVLAK